MEHKTKRVAHNWRSRLLAAIASREDAIRLTLAQEKLIRDARIVSDVLLEADRSFLKFGSQRSVRYGAGIHQAKGTFEAKHNELISKLFECGKLARDLNDLDGGVHKSWLSILVEEVSEAAAENRYESLRAELIQVASVALRFVGALDAERSSQQAELERAIRNMEGWF